MLSIHQVDVIDGTVYGGMHQQQLYEQDAVKKFVNENSETTVHVYT